MLPTGLALDHPAGALLQQYATTGCPATVSDPFTLNALEAAIHRGAHPSARSPAAIAALHKEVQEKVDQGFARLIPWDTLKQNLPTNIRISPIAAIPHKTRDFRMILDLSYMFTIDGTPWPSVNDSSTQAVSPPMNSMSQLGNVLPRLVHALATSPEDQGPWVFMKLDIKDGFWRLLVPEKDEHNFCYVLPQEDAAAPIQIVVPSALQMGWAPSPPYFSAATETARDVAATLQAQPDLPPHPLEALTITFDDALRVHQLTHPSKWSNLKLADYLKLLNHLLEVYVDDFVAAVQCTHPPALLHHSRALLHAIHSVFPPAPDPLANPDDEPVSLKKLCAGDGIWAFRKEILGWIFDGIHRTIELPPGKLQKLRHALKTVITREHVSVRNFQSLVGKLQHACLGIPNGKSLLGPLFKLLPSDHTSHTRRSHIQLPKGSDAHQALGDLRTLLKLTANRPTKCTQLVPGWPHFVGFCDACKYGAGGVWLSGKTSIHPVVWRVAWPRDITTLYEQKKLSVNDLEMAGLLLHYLVLEQLGLDLTNTHAATWCDNTSAVAWVRRQNSKSSRVAQRLLRALYTRHAANQSSPLAPWSIAGANNNMADLASRSFKKGGKGNFELNDSQFLNKFNSSFPLSQDASWQVHTLNTKLCSLVFAEMRLEQQPMGSWLRLATPVRNSGKTGLVSSPSLASQTPSSITCTNQNDLPLSRPLPLGYAMDTPDDKIALALKEFRKRWQPSPRPTNWTTNPVPRTKTKGEQPTGRPSGNSWNATEEKTHPLRPN
jgi:hypothetical protein